ARLSERSGERGERPPPDREPQIRMEGAVEPFKVVSERDEHAHDDEREHPPRHQDRAVEADHGRAAQPDQRDRHEHGRGDRGPERSPVQLVEGVRTQTDRAEEGEHGPREVPEVDVGNRARADHDVGEVPHRVRRVEQGHVIAPSSTWQSVEGRPLPLRTHRLTPQVTIAAPLDIARVWTGPIPAASHQPSCSRSGWACQYSWIDRLRKRAVLAHAGETTDPTSGITYRV